MNKKTLLFDFDGVIISSFDISYATMKESGLFSRSQDEYRRFFDGNFYEQEGILKGTNKDGAEDLQEMKETFFSKYTSKILEKGLAPGMKEMLEELSNDYRMVVVSSTVNDSIKSYLQNYDIDQHFEKIYGADVHLDKAVKTQMVFDDYGVTSPDCLFITDTLGDMREAAKKDVQCVGVTWGFHKPETLRKGNPVAIVDTVEELKAVIKREL